MKIKTTEQAGKDDLNKLVELTKENKPAQKKQGETQQEKNKRIKEEVLKGVFE